MLLENLKGSKNKNYILLTYFVLDYCKFLTSAYGEVNYNKGKIGNNHRYPVGTKATHSCFDGFKLIGSQKRTCKLGGTWTGQTAQCEHSKENIFNYYIFPKLFKVSLNYNLIHFVKLVKLVKNI